MFAPERVGSCHRCSRAFTAVSAPDRSVCAACACKFHNYDCYRKIGGCALAADVRALAAACPRCAGVCACGGGPFVCHAAKIAAKRRLSPASAPDADAAQCARRRRRLQQPEPAALPAPVNVSRPSPPPPPPPEWTRGNVVALHWGVTKHGEDFEALRARDRRLAGYSVDELRAKWAQLKPTLSHRCF